MHDAAREPFGDRGLANAGVADEQRIVLLPTTKHLDGAADLGVAADQRIDLALTRLLVEVDAIGFERVTLLLGLVALGVGLLLGAAHRTRFGHAGPLGDAVADVVDRIVAGHVLLLQEIGGMALAFGKDRNEHIGTGHFLPAGRLYMDDGALNHPLETGGWLAVLIVIADQVLQLGFQIGGQAPAQLVEINVTGPHHGRGILVVDQRQEKVLECRVFVVPLVRERQGTVQRLFKTARECGHLCFLWIPYVALVPPGVPLAVLYSPGVTSFPSRIAEDAGVCGRSPSPASPWSRPPRRCRSRIRRSHADAHAS